MSLITATIDPKAELRGLLNAAVALHANVVQIRVEDGRALVETMAAGRVVTTEDWPLERCAVALPAAFALCDGERAMLFGAAQGAMTGRFGLNCGNFMGGL